MKYRSILLFGAPGSGKGTQGAILGKRPSLVHLACGDVFRSLDRESELGKLFTKYTIGGGLVPDELTVELWRHTVRKMIAAGRFDLAKQTLTNLYNKRPTWLAQAHARLDAAVLAATAGPPICPTRLSWSGCRRSTRRGPAAGPRWRSLQPAPRGSGGRAGPCRGPGSVPETIG